MLAYLKVDPRLRFLKLSMVAADSGLMRTFAFPAGRLVLRNE